LAAVGAPHHRTADGAEVLYLEHHLRQYTRRNTSDFFVHKDLKGFLTRELDFYLKNEVLHLDELEAGGESRTEGWFQIMRVIKAIGGRIIEFLAQIEDFQKMLFEKRKFITETQYCITVGNIAEAFYADIAACDAQWQEWKALFHIDEEQQNLFTAPVKTRKERRVAFLKTHPTLVLDTKHFNQDLRDRLLASFEDLDGMTNGLLIHSENFQALNLLAGGYRGQVQFTYIDPPYNTGSDGFLYKDNYQHSSWLNMMWDRVMLMRVLMHKSGRLFCSIDDRENDLLLRMLRDVFADGQYLGAITWEKRTKSQNTETARRMLQSKVEYIHPFSADGSRQEFRLERTGAKEYPLSDAKGPYRLQRVEEMSLEGGRGRPTMVFPILDVSPRPGKQWQLGKEYILAKVAGEEVVLKNGVPYVCVRPKEEEQDTTRPFWSHFFDKETYGTAESGLELVDKRFGFGKGFLTVKPLALMQKLLFHTTNLTDTVVDAFGGSGTTGHAAIVLNRTDGGRRRFVLVEMGEYFDTLLVPRIMKATFCPEWKDGKPTRMATAEEAERSPRIVKYIRLESYEDTLNNIEVNGQAGQAALKFDDYMLSYMLDWETRESPTRLNLKQLASPFAYKLSITRNQETREQVMDIPETFAYLLGLHVSTRRVYDSDGHRYLVHRGQIDHREVVVIWRDTAQWEQKDYERDKLFVAGLKLAEGADEVFVNGDSLIPRAQSLDGVFKRRMFAPVGA